MKTPIILSVLSTLAILLLPSCVDPNYYGSYRGSGYYGSSSYTTLPYGYSRVHVGGMPYYYYGSRWYRRSGGRYISCARPHGYHGSIGRSHHYSSHGITHLPHGYRSVYVGGSRYYNHGNNWYRKSGSRYITCPQPHGYSRGHSKYYKHKDYHKPSSYRSHSGSKYKSGTYHKSSNHNRSGSHSYVKSHTDRGHSSHHSAQHKSKSKSNRHHHTQPVTTSVSRHSEPPSTPKIISSRQPRTSQKPPPRSKLHHYLKKHGKSN